MIGLLCSTLSASAQTPKGYSGRVEVGMTMVRFFSSSDLQGPKYLLSTTHGYSFGNGLFVGAGIGLGFYTDLPHNNESVVVEERRLIMPLYADVKYTFRNASSVKPFVEARGGMFKDFAGEDFSYGLGWFANPMVGIDISKFSVMFGVDINDCSYGNWSSGSGLRSYIGVAYNF